MLPYFGAIQSTGRNVVCVLSLIWSLVPASAAGQIDARITYRGFLTDVSGTPIDTTGFNLRFAFFPSSNGTNTPLRSEEHTVDVSNGVFSVLLGSSEGALDEIFGIPVSMELTVLGPGGDEVLTPRIPVTPTPQSFRAKFSEEAALSLRSITADTAERISSEALVAGTNIQIAENEGSFIISATAPPLLVSDRLSGPGGAPANALAVDAGGRIGIGVGDPSSNKVQAPMHVQTSQLFRDDTDQVPQSTVLTEAEQSRLALFSSGRPPVGSSIVLGEADKELVDQWSLGRASSQSNSGSRFSIRYGSSVDPDSNDEFFAIDDDGRVEIQRDAGSAQLLLRTDPKNDAGAELDTPQILFSQDGDQTRAMVGLEGAAGKSAKGSKDDALLVGTESKAPLQLITDDEVRLTVESDGTIVANSKIVANGSIDLPSRTSFISVSAGAFGQGGFRHFPCSTDGRFDMCARDGGALLHTPVQLPHNATVTSMTLQGVDPSTNAPNMILRLLRDDGEKLSTVLSASGLKEGRVTDKNIQSSRIDNSQHSYFVELRFTEGSDFALLNVRFEQAIIEYTTTEL